MKLDATVVIPCHNDCIIAEKLKENIREQIMQPKSIIIAHNGCGKGFDFSNKAKAINKTAKNINTKYTIILDSDVRLSKFCFSAFNEAIKNKINFGYSRVLQMDSDIIEKVKKEMDYEAYNGCCWYIKTSILKRNKIPEDIVTEDTAYYYIMKKRGYKQKIVYDAVCYVNYYEKTFKKKFRQGVRYCLGGLQLMSKRIEFSDGITVYVILLLQLFFILTIFPFIIINFLVFSEGYYYYFKNRKNKDRYSRFYSGLYLNVIPIVALYYFIFKKEIW